MKKNKKRLATKVLSTALLSSLIVTSLGNITHVKASDTVQEVTINSDVKAGFSSIADISDVDTNFKGILLTGKPYEIKNHDLENKKVLTVYQRNGLSALCDYVMYNADGTIHSTGYDRALYKIDMPKGGYIRVSVNTKDSGNYVSFDKASFESGFSIKELDKDVLGKKELPVGKYQDIVNTSNEPITFYLEKGNYGGECTILTYNKDNVIKEELNQQYNTRNFTIPANGKARFIQDKKSMVLYYDSSIESKFTIEGHDIGDKDLVKFDFSFEELPKSYMTYKEVKITNSGADKWFKVQSYKGLEIVGGQIKEKYLASGESMTVVVKPNTTSYENFEGELSVEEVSYSSTRKMVKTPVTFKAPEVGTKKVEIENKTNGDKDNKSYSVKIGENVADYAFSLNEVDNELAKSKGINKTYISSDKDGGTTNQHSVKYYDGARLAYEGKPLSAREIAGKSYSVSSDFSFSSAGGNKVLENFTVAQVMDATLKAGSDLAPYYLTISDCLVDMSKLDEMRYKFENGEISAEQLEYYTTGVYANVMNDNMSALLDTVERDVVTNFAVTSIGLLAGPSAWGIGALFQVAYATQDWAMANVNEAWDSGVSYWIGYGANSIVTGYSTNYKYTDKWGNNRTITLDDNLPS